jgi:hypothetical protein
MTKNTRKLLESVETPFHLFSFDGSAGGGSARKLLGRGGSGERGGGAEMCCVAMTTQGVPEKGWPSDARRQTQLVGTAAGVVHSYSAVLGLCWKNRGSPAPLAPAELGRADPPAVCREAEPDFPGLGPDSDPPIPHLCHVKLS